ncbi:Fur family transcriptional regulator [Paucihalobacter sp.]|uniref:Fur family transcriptional regulator n=1 Tax=Paucihalobacter sp. TaxID=2850405 RepID=UPI002FE1D819
MGIVRKTKSVDIIMSIFNEAENALSVVELVSRLKNDMNKTTVYRILERLEKNGFTHSFTDSDGLRWYAKCHDCTKNHHLDLHPHFQCKCCGKVACLSEKVPMPLFPNHQIDKAEIMLFGTCRECRN